MTDEIERISPAVRTFPAEPRPGVHVVSHNTGLPHDDGYDDPYSAKALYCTSGKDNVYRFIKDATGNVVSVELVPPEEAKNARGRKKSKAKTNRRGNKFL